jgi:hypothetical protein
LFKGRVCCGFAVVVEEEEEEEEERRAEGENMAAMEMEKWVWLCFFLLSLGLEDFPYPICGRELVLESKD